MNKPVGAEEWEAYWRIPDPDRSDNKWALYTRLALMVSDQVERQGSLVLADVGCGPGAFLDRLRGIEGVNGIGFDVSETVVDACKMRGHNAYVADATELPVDGAFGVIVCIDTLSCLPSKAEAIEHWGSLLSDGGVLILVMREGEIGDREMNEIVDGAELDAGLLKIVASAGGEKFDIFEARKS